MARSAEADDADADRSRALHIREALADAIGIAEVEIALGDQCFRQDRYREALRHYTRARNGLAPDKYGRLRAILDCNSANCLEALQRYGAASRLFERARAAFDKDGLRPTVAQVDHNRAYFAFVRGRYAEALALYDRAEAISAELGDERQLAQVALERAEVHLQMGMPRDAAARASAWRPRSESGWMRLTSTAAVSLASAEASSCSSALS